MTLPDVAYELEPDDRELLALVGRSLYDRCTTVRVQHLGRVGYSGSRMYQAQFSNRGLYYAVKTHDTDEITKEWAAVRSVGTYFPDARPPAPPVFAGDRGALAYPLVSPRVDSSKVTELKDILYDTAGRSSDDICDLISKLYATCTAAHHAVGRGDRDVHSEYERYLRKRTSTDLRLEEALGATRTGTFDWHGATVRDPRSALEDVKGTNLELSLGAVHGDLHANNIVIGPYGEPRLIDFAWASEESSILKDFVLMECSVRFHHFPKYADLTTQLAVDEALLQEDGPHLIAGLTSASSLAATWERMARIVEVIRREARDACGAGYSFNEYLLAQLFVLYGLLKYDTYEFRSAVRYLGLIAAVLT